MAKGDRLKKWATQLEEPASVKRDFGGYAVAVVLMIAIVILGTAFSPWLADRFNDGADPPTTTPTDVIDIVIRMALAMIAIVAGWFTLRRIRAAERTAAANESGQETDRFTSAIDQLGSDKVNIRIGGLYSLQALAQDRPERFAATIYDVIMAFIREQTRPDPDVEKARKEWLEAQARHDGEHDEFLLSGSKTPYDALPDTPPIPEWPRSGTDVETALKILTASRSLFDEHHPELEPGSPDVGPNLTSADLSGRTLVGLDLSGATLVHATFGGATLTGAVFRNATLHGAHFDRAILTEVYFTAAATALTQFNGATLTDVYFDGATLTTTHFRKATLTGAVFRKATLTEVDLTEANISNTGFTRATLTEVDFVEARCEMVNFNGATLTNVYFDGGTLTDTTFKAAEFTGSGLLLSDRFFNGTTARIRVTMPDGTVIDESETPSEE